MQIEMNTIYLWKDEITYLCIGFADQDAILAPYWSDDEDLSPEIQNDEYLVVSRNYYFESLKPLNKVDGHLIFE